VDVTKWNVGKGEVFNSMFATTDKLVLNKTDLKNWDMRNAVKINHMFYGALSIQELDLGGWDMPKLITTTHMFADCTNLKAVSFDDWNTPSLISLDCMFNDCDDLTYLDMSDIDTANVTEFSQMFERCTRLKKVDGMENWNTAKSGTFVEMFLNCSSLEELNWSTFDTRAAYNNYYDTNNSYSKAFNPIFSGVNNLTKLIVSDKISYYGNGTVPEADKLVFPDPKPMEGHTAMWRNVETGALYLGKDIPEFTAATYEAYYEPIATP
jgi:surface protein